MYQKYLLVQAICAAILFVTCHAGALPVEADFSVREGFPNPAVGSFGVVGTALPDGRYVLWNGDTVYIQAVVGNAGLNVVATGYAGDPGFATLSPDGHTVLLGAGFGDGTNANLYAFDTDNPQDFQSGTQIVTQSHFSGVYLTASLVLMDRGKSDFSGAELFVIDLTTRRRDNGEARTVLTSPSSPLRTQVLEKPVSSFSSNVCVSADGTDVYVMDGNTLELRRFVKADLINAFNTATPLDWTTDGTAIGTPGAYFSGGIVGETAGGTLVIPGSTGFLQPGGVQYVNSGTGAIIATLDPDGSQPFYTAIYNAATEDLIIRSSSAGGSVAYSTAAGLPSLPAATVLILVLSTLCLAGTALHRMHQS